ncbi:MAG: hypothetical protein NT099_02525 [Candidatus Saganbacteria bacterium]|nr:hypothetical protein [Candidatus Saganbacteria bacterium]
MFDRVIVSCPVKRLGSLMDFSPVLEGMSRFFPGRTVLVPMSRQAEHLWRYKLDDMREKGEALDVRGNRPNIIRELLERQRVLGIPLTDDYGTGAETLSQMLKLTPEAACWVGSKETEDYFRKCARDLIPVEVAPILKQYLSHVVDATPPTVIHGSVAVIQKALELSGQELPADFRAQPLVWTSDREVETAEGFFQRGGLEAGRTIGMHLASASYDVDRFIWPWRNFAEVADHFLEQNFQILLVTGSFFSGTHPGRDNYAWQDHREFMQELQKKHPSRRENVKLFYGDVLAEAEVIRRCRTFLSAETGPAHLASAVGTPKVTIAASEDQKFFWLLTGERDFGFVSMRGKQRGHRDIFSPEVDTVIEAMESILDGRTRSTAAG